MGIQADKQRAVDALGLAIQANGLADGQHMRLVEAAREGAAPMAGGAEGDALGGDARVGRECGVGGQQCGNDGGGV